MVMPKICEYLEKAFLSMNISHKRTLEDEKIFYQLTFHETGVLGGKMNVVIDKMFSTEIGAFAAKGISQDIRSNMLEKINEINREFRFIRIVMDKNNDIYSCQQFILFGNEEIMCKQIVTNIVAFYDLHSRAVRKIMETIRKE